MNRRSVVSTLAAGTAIILAAILFASPATASHEVPFKGTLQAIETANIMPPYNYPSGSGSGNATHLGLFAYSYNMTVYLPTLTGSDGSLEFVAANGDRLFAEGHGQGAPTDVPTVITITEWYTITGGTGRFEGASGSFVVQRQIDRATGAVSGSFDGAISLSHGG
jgi:hypothetical protein